DDAHVVTKVLPNVVDKALLYQNIDQEAMKNQVNLLLDQVYIREELAKRNLVAFVANGSILPRRSGVSDQPLQHAVLFSSPKKYEIKIELPSYKTVNFKGITECITIFFSGYY